MDVRLHATPRWRDVAREQIRTVGLNLRREAMVIAAVLGAATLILLRELLAGGPGSDSTETFPTAIISFLIPFAVWRREPRFGPAFLWTLPVGRRQLALAKVCAGAVWTMAALAVYVCWMLAIGLIAGAPPLQLIARVPFSGTLAAYIFGSAFVLGLRHPLRWLLGIAAISALVATAIQPYEQTTLRAGFAATAEAWENWLSVPPLARWAITTFLSFGGGLAALWAAVSRHAERRAN